MKKIIFVLVLFICLFSFGCAKKENNDTLKESGNISGIDYKIHYEFKTQNYDLTKSGYYVDSVNEPNSPYYYIITLGTRHTGGYSIEITNLKIDKDLNVSVIVKEKVPCDDCMVTQALTYPYVVLELSKPAKNIDIKDNLGNKFEKLN